ncbi:acylphosphatase [Dichotomicrobium thermohalophilum]|uniref:Acylphosphatase n=1 Tax=Dichotomicrobium thermohalophilum TaxID=933063 RepID=A0A397Q5R4_9HYPH|nr:acylphosphatase [Dichotomicrobium thermohalophilum]RIA56616.1 acylphosphatase [Dichotomicrobium thermohalophilum]
MAEQRTVHVRITGDVQGVGFRAWTRRQAAELGLSGWVRNMRDGAVEALFAGAQRDVDAMIQRCRSGPRAAIVDDVHILAEGGEVPEGFSVKPTM